jgi:hypothetical protein
MTEEELIKLRESKLRFSKAYYERNKRTYIYCECCDKNVQYTEYKKHLKSKKHLFCLIPKEEQEQIIASKREELKIRKREYSRLYYDTKRNNDPKNITINKISTEYNI